jgi:hypothetical protein
MERKNIGQAVSFPRPRNITKGERMTQAKPEYPIWICEPCGALYGKKKIKRATWHQDICDVCGTFQVTTEPRDFGHLRDGWQNHKSSLQQRGNE